MKIIISSKLWYMCLSVLFLYNNNYSTVFSRIVHNVPTDIQQIYLINNNLFLI